MTTAAEVELLARVGPRTPMGELMRQYWMIAGKSSELDADGDPMRLKLLGEKLIAFRDSNGKIGVIDHRCPHRCASLFFGRNEEGGIRCVYHGWKFDTDGNCLEMANVPAHQDFKHKVHAKAYKAAERNGLIWVFMGDQENVPELPPIEPTLVPDDDRTTNFFLRECNWLQAVEGELDTSHLGILHLGAVGTEALDETDSISRNVVANRAPEYVVEETDYGMMYGAYRPDIDGGIYWRVGQYLFPYWTMPPINDLAVNVLSHIYVPVDDEHTMIISMSKSDAYAGRKTVDGRRRVPGAQMAWDYAPRTTDWLGRWRLNANKENDYQIDREFQRTESYTGVQGIPLQDQVVTESMGPISDRTFEHLAPSDVMINRTRRWLVRMVTKFRETGEAPKTARDADRFAGIRGGNFTIEDDTDWIEAYDAIRDGAPLRVSTKAAE